MSESAVGLEPTLYRQQQEYKGFTRKPSQAAGELKDLLGIPTNPMLRTFYYNGDPKLLTLRLLAARLTGRNTPFTAFLTDQHHRGHFDTKENALFVREQDRFAELHELGHQFVQDTNPQLNKEIEVGFMNTEGAFDAVAKYAFDEGAAQWIAITTGLKTQDPKRVAEAIKEHNKMVSSAQDRKAVFDPTVMQTKIVSVKTFVKAYEKEIAESINTPSQLRKAAYDQLLYNIYRNAMSLGYVYTAVGVAKLLEQPGLLVKSAITELIKNPPTFDRLIETVTSCSELPAVS